QLFPPRRLHPARASTGQRRGLVVSLANHIRPCFHLRIEHLVITSPRSSSFTHDFQLHTFKSPFNQFTDHLLNTSQIHLTHFPQRSNKENTETSLLKPQSNFRRLPCSSRLLFSAGRHLRSAKHAQETSPVESNLWNAMAIRL
ncbi:hypothetical protein ACJJTC_011310, partial [Scirpophaga incertulas]